MSDAPQPRDPCPLRVRGVTKRFGDFVAVDDVSLEIAPGEIFALLGPNGAGKTTLIHCITGLARQTSGDISVFGYDTVSQFRSTRSLVGLVPQEISFDPFFTPMESLRIQMGLMGVRPDNARCEELLETMSLTGHRNAYTRNLSGGMKRRLLVAKALVHRPRLLFLDEPTAGVDVELRKDLWTEVLRLRDQGTTIILTTHYLEEAEQLADRVGVIHRGRIVLTENKAELMSRYGSRRVELVAASPIDELPQAPECRLERVDARTVSLEWTTPDALARALSVFSQHHEIVDVRMRQTSLEDIFVDLIRTADAERAEARA